jgi:multisubunit Na+/H+ antiporter MnhE subunit
VHDVVAWLRWWLALFLLWIAFVDNVFGVELAAGVGAAALGATAALVARMEERTRKFALTPRQLVALLGPAARIVPDFWRVVVAIPKRPQGRTRHMPIPASLRDSAGGRALAVASGSLTPNSVVVDIDREAGTMLVHELLT